MYYYYQLYTVLKMINANISVRHQDFYVFILNNLD